MRILPLNNEVIQSLSLLKLHAERVLTIDGVRPIWEVIEKAAKESETSQQDE